MKQNRILAEFKKNITTVYLLEGYFTTDFLNFYDNYIIYTQIFLDNPSRAPIFFNAEVSTGGFTAFCITRRI